MTKRKILPHKNLLVASEYCNWWSIVLTHNKVPCSFLLQTWWYPKRTNLVLIENPGAALLGSTRIMTTSNDQCCRGEDCNLRPRDYYRRERKAKSIDERTTGRIELSVRYIYSRQCLKY